MGNIMHANMITTHYRQKKKNNSNNNNTQYYCVYCQYTINAAWNETEKKSTTAKQVLLRANVPEYTHSEAIRLNGNLRAWNSVFVFFVHSARFAPMEFNSTHEIGCISKKIATMTIYAHIWEEETIHNKSFLAEYFFYCCGFALWDVCTTYKDNAK